MGFVALTTQGYPNRGASQNFGGGAALIGGVGEPGLGEFSGGRLLTPLDILLKQVTWRLTVAPGAGFGESIHVKKANNVAIASMFTIADLATDVTADLEGTCPAADPTSDATIQATMNYRSEWQSSGGGGMAVSQGFFCQEYLASSKSKSLFCSGIDFSTTVFNASNTFAPFLFVATTTGITEVSVQEPFPLAGTFKGIVIAWKSLLAGTNLALALRKEGSDTALAFTLAGIGASWQAIVDTTTAVSVLEGNLLAWRLQRTAGTGTSLNLLIGLLFS